MLFSGNIIYRTFSSNTKSERLQQLIRDKEWAAVVNYIPSKSSFLDVGCGAGYAMYKAKSEKDCKVYGIDPYPGARGVGRFLEQFPRKDITIREAYAEALPFDDSFFDVVYSSHVLEHVNNESKTLQEMSRVLNEDGIVIVGMPTATMAWIHLFSSIVFTTHIKVYEFFRFLFSKNPFKQFINIFRIKSHSYPRAKSIWYDVKHYRVSNWKRIIEDEFEIIEIIKPCLYPYPDYPQWISLHKNKRFSSSVFFVCRKNLKK